MMGYGFIDLDAMIESETNKSITELFEAGPAKFREIETHILHKTKTLSNYVIATGGGTPCFHDNMNWINQHGISIYIQLTPGSLFHRLLPSKSGRPLIAGKTDVELMEFIMETLKERERFYKKSKYVVKGEDLTAKILYEKLKEGEKLT